MLAFGSFALAEYQAYGIGAMEVGTFYALCKIYLSLLPESIPKRTRDENPLPSKGRQISRCGKVYWSPEQYLRQHAAGHAANRHTQNSL